jgi:hypothetical protein
VCIYKFAARSAWVEQNAAQGGFMMKQNKFFDAKTRCVLTAMAAFLLVFGLVLAGCPTDSPPDDEFTQQTNNATANDEATLGFVGEDVASSDNEVAEAKIVGDKIEITSRFVPGTALIMVSAHGTSTKAIIPVTVAADGSISIGAIIKRGPRQVSITIKGGGYEITGVSIADGYHNYYVGDSSDSYGADSDIAANGQKTFGPFTVDPGNYENYSTTVFVGLTVGAGSASGNIDADWPKLPKESYTFIVVPREIMGETFYYLEEEE